MITLEHLMNNMAYYCRAEFEAKNNKIAEKYAR